MLAAEIVSLRVFAGYAGWGSGQLRAEIEEGAWYVLPGDPLDPFMADPQRLWQAVLHRQGGELAMVATYPTTRGSTRLPAAPGPGSPPLADSAAAVRRSRIAVKSVPVSTEVLPDSRTGTETDIRPDLSHGDGDHERFAHYVDKTKIVDSAVSGNPVIALCGKVWVPSRDPKRFPICPDCKKSTTRCPPGPPAVIPAAAERRDGSAARGAG